MTLFRVIDQHPIFHLVAGSGSVRGACRRLGLRERQNRETYRDYALRVFDRRWRFAITHRYGSKSTNLFSGLGYWSPS